MPVRQLAIKTFAVRSVPSEIVIGGLCEASNFREPCKERREYSVPASRLTVPQSLTLIDKTDNRGLSPASSLPEKKRSDRLRFINNRWKTNCFPQGAAPFFRQAARWLLTDSDER